MGTGIDAAETTDTRWSVDASELNRRPGSDTGGDAGTRDSSASDAMDTVATRVARCPEPSDDNSSPYLCDDDCGWVSREPAQGFDIPDRPPHGGAQTAEEIRKRFPGGKFPENGGAFGVPVDMEPDKYNSEAWVEYGRDMEIYFAPIQMRSSYGTSSIRVTAVLNYEPVRGVYEHSSNDRSKILDKKTGTSAEFPLDGPIELFDITIPSEAFDRKGRYDIGLGWNVYGDIDRPGGWRRFRVYYGGTKPPKYPCMRRGKLQEVNQDEKAVFKRYFADAALYPGGEYNARNPFEMIEVEPGERVAVRYGVGPLHEHPTAMVLVPFMNGDPLDKRMFAHTPPATSATQVGFRDRFIIELPNKPGEYEIELGMWSLPYLDFKEWTEFDLRTDGMMNGTNHVKFVVKE